MNTAKKIRSEQAVARYIAEGKAYGPLPLGYRRRLVSGNIRRKKNIVYEVEINPEEKEIVEYIFNAYISGNFSITSLQDILYKKFNFKINRALLHRILRNKFYIGICQLGKTHKKRQLRDYKHIHPIFINEEIFNKVQEILDKRTTTSGGNKFGYGKPYKYRSLLKCGECLRTITPEMHKNIVYYHCNQKKLHKVTWVNEKTLDLLLNTELKTAIKIFKIKDEYNQFIEAIKNLPLMMQTRMIFNAFFESIYFNTDKTIKVILLSEQKVYWNISNCLSISKDTTEATEVSNLIPEPQRSILLYCKVASNIDKISESLNIDLLTLQNTLVDLQLDGLIDQNQAGQWVSL